MQVVGQLARAAGYAGWAITGQLTQYLNLSRIFSVGLQASPSDQTHVVTPILENYTLSTSLCDTCER